MSFQDQDQSPKRVCLGKIAGVHGVKGLVKILPFGEDPSLLNGSVFTDESGDDMLTITLKNTNGKFILAEIETVTSREQAEALKGCSLYVPRETLPAPEDGQYYFEDLVGLKVLDEQGREIGKVIAADNFGASDLLEIQPGSGESYYIPFTDDYVLSTDLENATVTIRPFEMG